MEVGGIQLDKALAIKGWMSPTELAWLADTAKHCQVIVEVGSFKGRSSRALADNTKGIVFCVDPWPDVYFKDNGEPLLTIGDAVYHEFIKNTSGCKNIVTFRGTFPHFEQAGIIESADFVFIDGDHREVALKADILAAMELTKKGSIIAGHDYTHKDWPAVKRVVDEWFPKHHSIDSIWWIRRY